MEIIIEEINIKINSEAGCDGACLQSQLLGRLK
jgi:hypothetical protein